MIVIREVLHCRPGKVREMVDRFKALSDIRERMGYGRFRILTDLSGERFWTVIVESDVERVDAFFEMEERLMAEQDAQDLFAGYHELVVGGCREMYRVAG